MDKMCWRAKLIIKFNLPEMRARIIFPMTTNVLMSCLHVPGYPADHGTLEMINASITETSWCFQVLGEGHSLFCACFVAGSLNWWRQMCSCCSEEKSRCLWSVFPAISMETFRRDRAWLGGCFHVSYVSFQVYRFTEKNCVTPFSLQSTCPQIREICVCQYFPGNELLELDAICKSM